MICKLQQSQSSDLPTKSTILKHHRKHNSANRCLQKTVITVLPDTKHLENVISLIIKDSAHSDKSHIDRLFIDCSTVNPISSRAIADVVHTQYQGLFVDAPMSGGVVGARAGTLTFMLGAPEALVPRIKPVLEMMGKTVWHCGGQGAGLAGKLANNYLLAISNIATAEAMNLGIKLGLQPAVLGNLINSCTGACWPSHTNNPVKGVVPTSASNRNYDGGFGVALMKKDLTLALNAAKEANAKLELGDKAAEVYELTEKNFKGKDFSVVYKYIGGDH